MSGVLVAINSLRLKPDGFLSCCVISLTPWFSIPAAHYLTSPGELYKIPIPWVSHWLNQTFWTQDLGPVRCVPDSAGHSSCSQAWAPLLGKQGSCVSGGFSETGGHSFEPGAWTGRGAVPFRAGSLMKPSRLFCLFGP